MPSAIRKAGDEVLSTLISFYLIAFNSLGRSHHQTMGLGVLNPPGHPDSDPLLRVPGTHVFWNTDVQLKDTDHIVLIPTVICPAPQFARLILLIAYIRSE